MSGNTFNSDILIAGAIAAFTVDLLVYPLDTLKTRIQSPDYARLYTNSVTGKPNPALFRGVYQGIGSVIIATLPSSGAFFTTYEQFKDLFTRINPTSAAHPNGLIPAPFIHSSASGLAELVSCAILTPAEVIKQNAQMVSANSPTNATIQTLAKFKSNPLALWRGYTALASRNLPFTALQFPMFERLKERIHLYRDQKGLSTGTVLESGTITAVSAGAAGSVAAVVTTPIDVIKTRIMLAAAEEGGSAAEKAAKTSQKTNADGLVDAFGKAVKPSKVSVQGAVQALNPMAPPKRNGRKSSWQIGKEVIQEQGWKGIWRGGALRGVWTFIGSGLYLGAYESGRVYLANRRGEKLDEAELM